MTKGKSFKQKYLENSRKYQEKFREKMKAAGWRQVNLWLDKETLQMVGDRKGKDLSRFISDAIKGTIISKLAENLTSKIDKKITSKKYSRYMSAEIENKIIELRGKGLSLHQISKELEQQGIVSANGKQYSTGTISKVITRVRSRQG